MPALTQAQVVLVGAGPGDPGLLTVRAAECLARAELLIYDKLVPKSILDRAPASAERVCVSELAPCHSEATARICGRMIEAARQGRRVVRLKGGDPFVFGRGGEEAEALHAAGIAFEVVPGVTAALGAAACAGIPLTHREHASAVAFVTGHENPAKPESALDWPALARFPGTLVVYMGVAQLPRIVAALLAHGKAPDTSTAAVHRATTGEQQTVEAPLGELSAAAQAAGLKAPAIIIIGSVASLRPRLAWFERRPLFGKRVLVTRPPHQAGGLVNRLEQLGAVPLTLPAVEIGPPPNPSAVDQALAALGGYHWLVFTSSNGVHALIRRLLQTGRDLRALGHLRLAAIGPATADALREYHLETDVMPDEYRSEGLAAALRPHVSGQRVLLARADRGRDLLRRELAEVATVEQVAVYSQTDAVAADAEAFDHLRRGEVNYVTLTSSNIARAFLQALDERCRERIINGRMRLVSISPVTSQEIRAIGMPVAAEATVYTSDGLVDALLRLVSAEEDRE